MKSMLALLRILSGGFEGYYVVMKEFLVEKLKRFIWSKGSRSLNDTQTVGSSKKANQTSLMSVTSHCSCQGEKQDFSFVLISHLDVRRKTDHTDDRSHPCRSQNGSECSGIK